MRRFIILVSSYRNFLFSSSVSISSSASSQVLFCVCRTYFFLSPSCPAVLLFAFASSNEVSRPPPALRRHRSRPIPIPQLALETVSIFVRYWTEVHTHLAHLNTPLPSLLLSEKIKHAVLTRHYSLCLVWSYDVPRPLIVGPLHTLRPFPVVSPTPTCSCPISKLHPCTLRRYCDPPVLDPSPPHSSAPLRHFPVVAFSAAVEPLPFSVSRFTSL